MYADGGIKVRAARDIEPGEEIFASYDMCVDCDDAEEYWGTPEILKDFGFLEGYPHRWVYVDQNIWFVIDQAETQNGTLEIYFDTEDEESFGIPDVSAISFMENELKRLEKLGGHFTLSQFPAVPKHEWDTIVDFYQATSTALKMGIAASKAYHEGGGRVWKEDGFLFFY